MSWGAVGLIAIAVLLWIGCWLLVMIRPRRRAEFLGASVLLALVLFAVAPGGLTPPVEARTAGRAPARACADVKAGMSRTDVRDALDEPASVQSEEDTYGPGAEAWVYADTGCVVRFVDGVVRSVDFESLK